MEKNVAIMMADLSGYTALTETHGSVSAADLIDKYIHIAENCLVGDSKLHQRAGDEIMFVSDSPDALLATALELEAKTAGEEYFLQVHGGLHYGKLLKRSDNYFGSALNLASRITAQAEAGTFWCSDEFVHSITDRSVCRFKSKGNFVFKNIEGEIEVFELSIEKTRNKYVDPVCRMVILDTQKAIPHSHDDELYFCSSECLQIYNRKYQSIEAVLNQTGVQYFS
jgi:adenylate cyclase